MEFRANYKMEFKDYLDFNIFHNVKMMVLVSVLILFIPPFIVWIRYIVDYDEAAVPAFFLVLTISVLVAVLFFFLQLFSMRIQSKKQYNSSKAMQVSSEVVINESGLAISSEYGNSFLKWEDVYKAAESKKAIYIYVSRLQALFFPKRLFHKQDEAVLRKLLCTYLYAKNNRLKAAK